MDKNENKQEDDFKGYLNYKASEANANISKLKDRLKEDKDITALKRDERKYTSGFTILAHINVGLSIILLIVLCATFPEPATIVSFIISSIISIACLYGLGGARERINYLEEDFENIENENKEIKNKLKQLEKELRNKVDKRDLDNKE